MVQDEVRAAARALSIEYAIRDVVVPATALEAQGHDIIKLNIGDPIAYPGLPTPQHMVDAYAEAVQNGMNGYSPSYGLPALREAVAKEEQSKGWPATSDDIYVCHGVTEALQLLFAAVLEEGDVVLAPGPHYPPYMAYPQMYGASTIEYHLDANDGWKIDLADLESKMSEHVRFVVLINPNNPTGNVATPEEVDAVLRIVKDWPQCMVIADEIYDGLDFTGHHVSVASRSRDVPVVTLNGVSKVFFAPGWRIGWFGLHDPLKALGEVREALERLLRSRLCASTPAQQGYLAAVTGRGWVHTWNASKHNGKGAWTESPQSRGLRLKHLGVRSTCSYASPMGHGHRTTNSSCWICFTKSMFCWCMGVDSVPTKARVTFDWSTWPTYRFWTKPLTASSASSTGTGKQPCRRWILEQALTPLKHEPSAGDFAGHGLAPSCRCCTGGHRSAERAES